MAEETEKAAFERVDEARAALMEGTDVLKQAANDAREHNHPDKGKQLDFCAGCLIDLRDSLTMPMPRNLVNSGCGG